MTDVTTADDRRWRGAMRGERPATDVAAGRTRRADLEALLHDLEQAAADRAPRGVALSDEVKARIEYLHDQVRDATDRCQRKFVPKADRQRVREALAAERVALDELGFDSYSAFVLVTTAPAAAGPADEFPPGFHARITALVGPGCASIAEALTAVRTELTAMPPAPAAPPPIAPVAPPVAPVAPAVAPDVGEPPLAAEPPVAAVAEASAPVAVAPCAPAAPTPSADEPPAPQAAAGDAPTDQEATMTVTDDTRTADFATLFAHLQDAASAVVAGVASARAEAEGAIAALAHEREQAAADLEALRNEAAAARADAQGRRERAEQEANEIVAAARADADRIRADARTKADALDARLTDLRGQIAQLATDLNG